MDHCSHPKEVVKEFVTLVSILFEHYISSMFDDIFWSYQSKHQENFRKFMKPVQNCIFLVNICQERSCNQLKLT